MQQSRLWLVEIRGERTQQEIADQAGISRSCLANIEGGKRTPKIPTAIRIAHTLGFEWTKFFEEHEKRILA